MDDANSLIPKGPFARNLASTVIEMSFPLSEICNCPSIP